jgi:signal transduction histidine kinase
MTAELKKTGIDMVADIPWGTHFCHFYETKEDLFDILIPYFKAGLENNEFCMWVVFPPGCEANAREALRREIPGIDQRLAAGDIEILPHTQWYLRGGAFELQRVIDGWREKLTQSLARGYAGMRVNGNEAWLTKEEWKDFSAYEEKLNNLIANQRMIVLCTYPLAMVQAAELFDVARTHQFAIAKRRGKVEVVESSELKQAWAEMKRLNEELELRVLERTNELTAANKKLREEIIERMRIEEALRTTTEQLRALAVRLTSAREEEAKRIARELHDELGSALTTLNWEMESIHKFCSEAGNHLDLPTLLEMIAGVTRKVETAVDTLRQISSELLPPVLDEFGLLAALEWYGEQMASRTGIAINVQGDELEPRLSPQAEISLFRIAQEALNNVVKHARATEVRITLEEEKGTVRLVISDNGVGFDTSRIAAAGRRRGIGILNMSERAQSVGGLCRVESSPGKGTRVITEIGRNDPPGDHLQDPFSR